MKRFKSLLFSLLLVSVLLVTGCGNKTAITSEDFKQKMEEKQYSVDDLTAMFDDSFNMNKVYVATNSDTTYQISFYELKDSDTAANFYEENKKDLEDNKGTGYVDSSVNLNNYSKYTLETNDEYKLLSKIDNTVIILNVKKNYKDEVNSIIKELGY